MTKKKRSVLLTVLTLMLCVALVAGGTYALFSDEVKLQNHMQAGELNVGLYRTKLVAKALDPKTGLLTDGTPDTTRINFSDPANNDVNVFGLTENDKIVPECVYTAEMLIVNNTDVAFGYWIEIVFNTEGPTAQPYDDFDKALAEQLEVTVLIGDNTTGESKPIKGAAGPFGSESAPLGILTKEAGKNEAEFTISVKFRGLDHETNNKAQGGAIFFDVVVHAVQVTELP